MIKIIRNILLLSFFTILLSVIGGYLYFFQFGGMESFVVNKLNNLVGEESPLTISVGRIHGSIVSGVTIDDITIKSKDSSIVSSTIIISRVQARYSLMQLWDRNYLFDRIEVDSLLVSLSRDSSGKWLLPLPKIKPPTSGKSSSEISIGHLDIKNATLQLNQENDTLLFSDLHLITSLIAEGGTYSIDLRHLAFKANRSAMGIDLLSGKLTLSGKNILFQEMKLRKDGMLLKADGSLDINTKYGNVEYAIDKIDLAVVSYLFGGKLNGLLDLNGQVIVDENGVHGQTSVSGNLMIAEFDNLFVDFSFADKILSLDTLYGSIFNGCGVDGSGKLDFSGDVKQYSLNTEMHNFDLKQLVKGAFSSDLSGSIKLEGSSFKHEDMELVFDVDLWESSFDEYPLQYASGPIIVTTKAVRFPRAFIVDYFENRFEVLGAISYRDEMRLEIAADLKNLDRYKGKLFIDQPGGRAVAQATLSGKTSDPDLKGWLSSDSLLIYGLYTDSAYSTYNIKRFLTGRQGFVDLSLSSGDMWEIPYDSGFIALTLDSEIVKIDTVSFASQYAQISSRGKLNQGSSPWQLTLDSLSILFLERDFFNRSNIVIEIDTLGFDFKKATIGKGSAELNVLGIAGFDESLGLNINVKDISIAPWLFLFDKDLQLDGYLSGAAHLSGDFVNPEMSVDGRFDSLIYRDVPLGDLYLTAGYRDQRIFIDSLVVEAHPGRYFVDGSFYYDLSFSNESTERLPDKPIDLRIKGSDSRFDLVPLFLPSVEQLDGDFYLDVLVNGTPTEPHLEGGGYLRNGRLKYFDLADTVRTDSAAFKMEDNRIIFDEVEIYVYDKRNKKNAYAEIDGELIVEAIDTLHYDIDLNITKPFPFQYDLDDIKGIVEGELHVLGNTPPTVTGDLTLLSGRYQTEFSDDKEGSPLLLALSGENSWDLNINIDILSNYWIKNQDIDAEFSGFLNIIREKGKYRFIGELEILKGKGYLFDKTFRIESGSRVTFEDIDYPNPRLDIMAVARIPVVRFAEEEQRGQADTLCVQVGGMMETPTFSTCAGDTLFTNEDILPLIVANYYGSSTSAGRIEERISQLISTQVSQIGTRRLGWFETFEIDPIYEGNLDISRTRVTLGRYTSQYLYVYGSSPVTGSGQELGFEYRVNKAFLLEGRRDEKELYHLNLKLHWEF